MENWQIQKMAQLTQLGIQDPAHVHWNLAVPALYEEAIRRREGMLSREQALVVKTSPYTGRLPKDKFIVHEPSSDDLIGWGPVNQPFEVAKFDALLRRMGAYCRSKDLFVQDCYAGADPRYRLPIRVISTRATGALFAGTMFIQEKNPQIWQQHEPQFTVLHAPGFHADAEHDGTHSGAFILIHFAKKLILIGGTAYSGEIKKAVFSVMNFLLPQKAVLPMHCSANYGRDENDVAIFFGLSGTGKTTLSADRDRTLIGDDEHGWSEHGVFNFEGGCYAKVIRLTPESEPEIYQAVQRFGTLLENVSLDPRTRAVDFNDETLTENTRASYPIAHMPRMAPLGMGGHPKSILMLTCDAFGVLPPVAKLTAEQAQYHFLCGYTAKVAGTEAGVCEPQATFSPCFGQPFMPLPPRIYARLLGDKIQRHHTDVWLVNTGWSGGACGVGQRMALPVTRAIVRAILNGSLKKAPMWQDSLFGFQIPKHCPDVPDAVLNPKQTWPDPAAYERKARHLATLFQSHFREHADQHTADLLAAGPRL